MNLASLHVSVFFLCFPFCLVESKVIRTQGSIPNFIQKSTCTPQYSPESRDPGLTWIFQSMTKSMLGTFQITVFKKKSLQKSCRFLGSGNLYDFAVRKDPKVTGNFEYKKSESSFVKLVLNHSQASNLGGQILARKPGHWFDTYGTVLRLN